MGSNTNAEFTRLSPVRSAIHPVLNHFLLLLPECLSVFLTSFPQTIRNMAKTLQFKVTLLNVKPVIWRRFEIEENIMFFDLHQVIQLVMGWENSHLYQFIFDKNNFIGDPEMLEEGNFEVADDMETEVAAILDEPGSEIMYEYDFGDGWMHQVVLEKISEGKPKHNYPFCVNGENSCPPEDCGGPGLRGARAGTGALLCGRNRQHGGAG